ncbi:MAG: gluconeogenesis factor YvcK family protein [bacterium]
MRRITRKIYRLMGGRKTLLRIRRSLRWLYPGMGVKRWILLSLLGAFLLSGGVILLFELRLIDALGWTIKQFYLLTGRLLPTRWAGIGLLVMGTAILIIAIQRAIKGILVNVRAPKGKALSDVIYNRKLLSSGPKIVTIGGGTGLSTILRGLKEFTSNITAIVTVTDEGGSSGRLRKDFDIPPPGDIRNCLVALAECEPYMQNLFQFRFDKGEGLRGHSLGNLLITAMTRITGDFEKGIEQVSDILAVRGRVLPSTKERVVLVAEMEDGEVVMGETNITSARKRIRRLSIEPLASLLPEAKRAIMEADLIIIGPGSLYTSVLSNLLVEGMVEALEKSKGKKVYICNLMTERGETDGFKASDHIKAIRDIIGKIPFQYVIVNTARPRPEILEKYKEEEADFVEPDIEELRKLRVRVVAQPLIRQLAPLRHDHRKLARLLISLC